MFDSILDPTIGAAAAADLAAAGMAGGPGGPAEGEEAFPMMPLGRGDPGPGNRGGQRRDLHGLPPVRLGLLVRSLGPRPLVGRVAAGRTPGGVPVTIDQAQLEQLKQTLQADDYRLDVDVQGDTADVAIVAGPDACEECLVPKPLMQSMLAPVLGVQPESIRLTYPADEG
ncbi:hypothetical protein DQ238_03675 [Geodermatophilus sp. TF02-6]|uniref:hypothetical protein n=1 Tax=Geodermatophilus sp. TF02-6 TaxID=2250575 RepID=UPI000DEBEA38|nr:hypothetical protein [Geodermatophilus sp. TF02-6]RBY82407.1 hypothetical protein DQ238_03675 [Geodermatophilus sp. TF02-6]